MAQGSSKNLMVIIAIVVIALLGYFAYTSMNAPVDAPTDDEMMDDTMDEAMDDTMDDEMMDDTTVEGEVEVTE